MKNKFLGIICTLYSIFILFIVLFDKLKYFLAPNMQLYIKLSIMPLFIMGMILIFNKKVSYKFKISDLILFLPIILFAFVGDGRLSNSFASNRTTNFKSSQKVVSKSSNVNKKKEIKKEVNIEKDNNEDIKNQDTDKEDFSNIYFDVNDESYLGLANHITFPDDFSEYENKTIRVRGFAINEGEYIPDGYFAIGKYTITCCAADAEFAGFIVKKPESEIKKDSWYEITGTLKRLKNGEIDEMYIEIKSIEEIDKNSEEQYVYPCYSYGNECKELLKYNLRY